MQYTKEERLDIARRVVEHEFSYKSASEQFSVSMPTISNWVAQYKRINGIQVDGRLKISKPLGQKDLDDLNLMSKEQLIDEVIKARIGEERAKKGYFVEGGGQRKEFVSLFNKNIKWYMNYRKNFQSKDSVNWWRSIEADSTNGNLESIIHHAKQ